MAGSVGRKPISPTSSSAHSEEARRRRHFGRRKGPSLSAHQKQLFETLLPRLALRPKPGLDPRLYFPPPTSGEADAGPSEVWLEVGFGGGEHLLWQADAHRHVGIIGAEPYVSGVAKLLSKIASSSGSSNIRIYMEDARDIVDALPDASLSRVFVLFPDPWPKTRHHKRRFIQTEMLGELARVMKPGAELRFATDENGYLVWALERLTAHPAFVWSAQAPSDWRGRTPDWPQTRYEAKALKDGRACVYLKFLRAGR
jgi:tRNA (guanine-N7-)-methyltransferase